MLTLLILFPNIDSSIQTLINYYYYYSGLCNKYMNDMLVYNTALTKHGLELIKDIHLILCGLISLIVCNITLHNSTC